MKKQTWINDIETLHSTFTSTYLNYDTEEKVVFEISKRKNDLAKLKEFVKNNIEYCITFNGVHFDDLVTNWLVNQNFDRLTGEQIAHKIYTVAQCIIDDNYEKHKPYTKYKYNLPYEQIDLYLFWSKMLRISKKLSLKLFAVNLDLNIQEMPIHHSQQELNDVEIDLVLQYNLNDCIVTKSLAKELREEINLRIAIQEECGLPCLSWDTIKIGSELLLDLYCKETYHEVDHSLSFNEYKKQIKNTETVKPTKLYFKNILPTVNFKTEFFKQVYFDMKVSINTYGRDYIYTNPDKSKIKLSFSVGGLHSVNRNQAFNKADLIATAIKTIDVASLYPTLYINNGYFAEKYKTVLQKITFDKRAERFAAKKAKQKTKDKLYKLLLNGVSGLLQNEYSWLYSMESAIAMRLHGQLILARTIEELGFVGISIISTNTDGIEAIVRIDQEQAFSDVQRLIEQEFNLIYEEEEYEFINYKTVNDYIALTTSGKVKTKGEFVWQDETRPGKKLLDASNEFLVIPKAVQAYFVNDTPVEQFIKNHQNIYDFCAAKKVDKSFDVIFREKKQQQLNRYFVCTRSKGAYLYKQKRNSERNLEAVLKGVSIELLNKQADKPINEYAVDYGYYIEKAKSQIALFRKTQYELF